MVSIFYWNTAGKKELTALALEDDREHDFIAIQEPWINSLTKGVYCPNSSRYRAIYYKGRAALYVHKRHEISTWEQDGGHDWCKATLQSQGRAVTVFSIYSHPSPNEEGSPLEYLTA